MYLLKEKNKVIENSEEMQVDEAWVRYKFSKDDVQHIINMRLEDNWIQAPRDIEVWIGKHKIVQVRYTGPRQRSIIDSEAVALRLREKQGMRSSRARAIRWAYKKKRAKPLQEIFWTKRKMMNPFHAKLLSLTRNGLGQ